MKPNVTREVYIYIDPIAFLDWWYSVPDALKEEVLNRVGAPPFVAREALVSEETPIQSE